MANANDVVNLMSTLSARANAVRTATDATYAHARVRLLDALETGYRYQDEGQGGIDSRTWGSFQDMMAAAAYTYRAEHAERFPSEVPAGTSAPSTPSTPATPVSAPATSTPPRSVPAAPRSTPSTPARTATPTYTPPRSSMPAEPSYAPSAPAGAPSGKGGTAAQQTATPGGKGGMPTAGGGYQQPQQPQQQGFNFFTWLNPPSRPVYLRPWFLGLGVSSIAALTYALWKATEETRKPAPAPKRQVPKTLVQ